MDAAEPANPFDTRVHEIDELLNDLPSQPEESSPRLRMVTNPAEVEAVLHSPAIERIDLMRHVAGSGLLFSDGPLWKSRRRIMQPAFPGRYPEHSREDVEWSIAGMSERLDHFERTQQPFGLLSELLRFTTRAIYRVGFGIDLPSDHDLVPTLTRFFDAAGTTILTVIDPRGMVNAEAMRKMASARAEIDREIDRIIDVRTGTTRGEDVLSHLLQAAEDHGNPDEVGLRDELRTILLGGTETTSNVLTWLLLLLDAHPDVRDRIEQELDADPHTCPPLLQAALHETMRLFPPVWFIARRATNDAEARDLSFKEGEWVIISTYLVQRNPEIWEDPHRFDPSRFMPGVDRPHRYAWFPFGGGRHLCLGRNLGDLETTMAAMAIMRRYRVTRSSPRQPHPRVGLVLKPDEDVQVRIQSRKHENR